MNLDEVLVRSTSDHTHLCPRQILGARIGMAGPAALGLDIPRADKRLLVIVETDGCFADGVQAATGCSVGHRTLRVEDYGKAAATFIDTRNGQAVRVAPRLDVRARAAAYAPNEKRHYFAQLHAYQGMPDEDLLIVTPVFLTFPLESLISRPGVRVNCDVCGEEIINERQVVRDGIQSCRACAEPAYYQAHPGYLAEFSFPGLAKLPRSMEV